MRVDSQFGFWLFVRNHNKISSNINEYLLVAHEIMVDLLRIIIRVLIYCSCILGIKKNIIQLRRPS